MGLASVLVDSSGVLQQPAKDLTPDSDQSAEALSKYFSNGVAGLISQSNLFLFRTLNSPWHNDTFASEFIHYFMNRAEKSLRLTDPTQPLPTFEDVEAPMNSAYAQLFAIWLGVNRELLFLPATSDTAQVQGQILTPEERLFFVLPLFIISETILGMYVIVSILVYLRRPGRYLPRMPISIAAVIALFASSAAVEDLKDTFNMTTKEREKYFNDLNHRYGYGSYIGSDGAVHVGIEMVPYVRYMKDVTFEGSRVERALRKRTKEQSSLTTSAEYSNVLLQDVGQRRISATPARRGAASITNTEYEPVQGDEFDGGRSSSPAALSSVVSFTGTGYALVPSGDVEAGRPVSLLAPSS
jgi:hypothetical protein